jgi:hypothetical protein
MEYICARQQTGRYKHRVERVIERVDAGMKPPTYEFVSLEVLARCASITGPGPISEALAQFARRMNAGETPICLQVIDGVYPATLLVFDAVNPPVEIPEGWQATSRGVGKSVKCIGRRTQRPRERQKESAGS